MSAVPQTPTNPGARLGSQRVNLPVGNKNGKFDCLDFSDGGFFFSLHTIASVWPKNIARRPIQNTFAGLPSF